MWVANQSRSMREKKVAKQEAKILEWDSMEEGRVLHWMWEVSGQKQPTACEEEDEHGQGCWGKAVPVTGSGGGRSKTREKSNRGHFPHCLWKIYNNLQPKLWLLAGRSCLAVRARPLWEQAPQENWGCCPAVTSRLQCSCPRKSTRLSQTSFEGKAPTKRQSGSRARPDSKLTARVNV